MKKLNNKQKSVLVNGLSIVCLAIMVLLFASSCNKDFSNSLRSDYPNDTTNVNVGKRKVLYIILDGVRGNALSTLLPTNMNLLARNSIYTYDGLNDYETNATTTNAASWANMITGVTTSKHNVTSEDFSGNDLADYPSLFTQLKAANSKYRTVSIAASASFNTNLAVDATDKQTVSTDVDVKDALINELKTKDADLVVAQFHSAEAEGAAGGYETTNLAYTAAITTLDSYIGNIITELKARPTFSNENWLVVIASNKGGIEANTPNDPNIGAFGDTRRNNFVIYYNPKFSTQPIIKPDANSFAYSGFGPNFVSNASSTGIATLSNTAIGNFGTSGDYTLMFKIRYNGGTGASFGFPNFFSKLPSSGAGWRFFFGTANFQLAGLTSATLSNSSVNIKDGVWHSIAFKIYNNASNTRTISLFYDGVSIATGSMQGRNADNSVPLKIGAPLNASSVFLMKDLAIYNISMSDTELAGNMRRQITPTSQYFANLIGWWPGDEPSGTTIADLSGNGNDFTANATVTRAPFEDVSPNISPLITPASYRTVINSVDIPQQIYHWMGILPQANWSLDGKVWKILYKDVRN